MRLICLGLLGLAFALGACGGDDDDGGNGGGGGGAGGGETVSAESYAKSLCTATADWVKSLQSRAGDIGSSLSPGSSPEEGRDVLVDFLNDVVADTEEWIAALEEAGTPDVDGGEAFAEDIRQAADEAKGVLEEAQAGAEDLPTGDPQAFAREASEVGNSTQEALGKVGDTITAPESDELKKAVQASSECQEIGSTG